VNVGVTKHAAGSATGLRVLVVEDHAVLSDALCLTFRLEGMEPSTPSSLDHDVIVGSAEATTADVVLCDLNLGIGGPAVDLVRRLTECGFPVLVLTGNHDEGLHGEALAAGAGAVLHKGAAFDEVCAALHSVAEGRAVVRPARRDELLGRGRERRAIVERIERLSPRERQVFAALCDGQAADAIARRELVSLDTVRSHIRAILRKLEVSSQLGAVAMARKVEWPPPA
jgi:DNA-binding NarL/FixJ family response regulator